MTTQSHCIADFSRSNAASVVAVIGMTLVLRSVFVGIPVAVWAPVVARTPVAVRTPVVMPVSIVAWTGAFRTIVAARLRWAAAVHLLV